MRKRYIPKHYSPVLKQKLYTLQQESKSVEEYYKEMEILMNRDDGVNITHAEAIWILGTFRTSIIVNDQHVHKY